MNFRKLFLSLSLLIAVSLSAFSQSDTVSLNTIIAKTAKLAEVHPYEKVYLHFDKPYYAIGDTIWFKAYLTADVHQPSLISKIVYVDVISSKDSIVQSLKLQVTGSVAFGNVTLASPLYRQGNYHFRAYTNWMRNDDPAYFFNKTIAVGSINNTVNTNISLSGSVKGNTSKVTAKVSYKDANGRPYANKKVSWRVVTTDEETLGKSKGTTSANGILDISFNTNKADQVPTSSLITEINITDDKSITNSFPLTHATDQPDVQFFPESGNLISGIRSRVAFKAIRPDGLGMEVKGTITDNTGAVVAEIASQHLGMGVFALMPEGDKSYKANITFPDGSQSSYNLPKAQPEGMALAVYNTDPDNINLKLSASPSFFQKNQNKQFYIVAQNGEFIFFAAKTNLQNSSYSSLISKSKFPSGVIKFTLFTDHGEPIAERITFVLRNDLLNLTAKTAQPVYAPRQKVTLSVSAQKGAQPAEANLSATVIDETKVPYDENSETTILTNLLLTSELKGYVEKPNYYFNNPNEKTAADLDILMLTQGYRRFSFKDVIVNKYPPNTFLPEQGISISGTLRNSTGLPISRGSLSMIVGDRKTSVNTIANASGEFKFSNLLYPDSTKITISAKNNPNSFSMMILLDNSTYQAATPNINAPDAIANIDSTMNAYLLNSKQQAANSHVLKEVNIQSTRVEKKPSHEDYPALTGIGMVPDQLITGDRITGCPFIYQCLQSVGFGLTYRDDNLYVTRSYNAGDKRPVSVYLNGLSVDFSYLQNVSSSDVESVEVFLNDGLSGINRMNNTNGVIVINSKVVKHVQMSKADIMAVIAASQSTAVNTFFRGYAQARVFYSPKYDPAIKYTLGNDLRSTVYWNPKVVTDKTGATSFEFFNSDAKGSYRVIIEGIDNNGNIGRSIYHYKVQ